MNTDASRTAVIAVVPAKGEADRVSATVAALLRVPGVDVVVVVDDGSTDRTTDLAREAGATVVRHDRNRGKAAAMATGAEHVAGLDAGAALLFVDADLQESAETLAPLITPILDGAAEMTIAILPPQRQAGGGFGFVVRMARAGIERTTGWSATQPLSGMRCLTREAFDAASPLASGWGVEVGLTVDVLRGGGRVREVPVDLHHRVTGRDVRAQLHRARQYRDAWWALARRGAWNPRRSRTRPRPNS